MAERSRHDAGRPVMRLAVVSMHTSPTAALGQSANGGLNVYVRETTAAFDDAGIAVDVFTRTQDRFEPQVETIGPRSRVVYLPAGRGGDDKYSLAGSVDAFAQEIESWAADENGPYDLVHSHYWLSGLVAHRLRDAWGCPWVHTAHTLGAVKNRALADGASPEPRTRIEAEARIAAAADLLVASTAEEAEDLEAAYRAGSGSIRVVAPGVDLMRFAPAGREEAQAAIGQPGCRLLLFVGRLERLKGAEVALRALAMLPSELADVSLLVIGEDSKDAAESEMERLRALAGRLRISERVIFMGSVPHAQLDCFYSAAEGLLMPSHSESFGLVALEAQACGCPVIAADVSGLRSVVRDGVTGFLVPGHEPLDYARRAAELLGDRELSSQMGRSGTLLAQRFPWSRTAERLREIYEGLVAGSQLSVHSSALHE